MLIYGLMKYIEKIPARYDRMMNILTFGGHGRSQKIIMSMISDGMRVLDIGCGSGALAVKCAEAGAEVAAVDSSSQMLSILKSRIRGAKFEKRITAVECGSASVDIILKGRQFDVVIMSMMLGELSPLVRAKTLKSAAALLSENGKIIICDELWPENFILSAIYHFLYWIFFIPNFILTRTLITPVKKLEKDLTDAGLKVTERESVFLGIISILKILKI